MNSPLSPTQDHQEISQPAFAEPPVVQENNITNSKNSSTKRRRKKFSKKFLQGIKNLLLDNLMDDLSSSSDSDDFDIEDKVKELRFQLSFHHEELQNAIEKRDSISVSSFLYIFRLIIF